jgi:hypothetical protein
MTRITSTTSRGARRVQVLQRDAVDVRGELEHRVLRRVEDQLPGAQVLLAERVDHGDPVGRGVAQEAVPGHALQLRDGLCGEAVGVGRRRDVGRDAHELPVPGGRVLAEPLRRQPAVDHRGGRGRHPAHRDDGAETERSEHRQLEAAHRLGHVGQRVERHGVAVRGGVIEPADAACVDDHHRDPSHGRRC